MSRYFPSTAECRAAAWIGLIALLYAAHAASAEIAIVKSSDAEPYTKAQKAIEERLADHKHNIREFLAKDLSDKGLVKSLGKADVIVAIGTPAARWLQKQTPEEIKLVYCMVPNADDAGLLQGRSSHGVTTDVSLAEQLKLIAEALPNARSIGMLYHSDTAEGKSQFKSMTGALPEGWKLQAVAVNEQPSVAAAIDSLTGKHVDVIWTTADSKLYDTASVRTLLLASVRSKTPVWGFSTAFVRAGALLGVGVEPAAQGKQAADIVSKWLSGEQSGLEKAQPPREFQIAVNLIVAEQLGIEVPDVLIRRATYTFRPDK